MDMKRLYNGICFKTYQYTQAILCDSSRHNNSMSHTDHTVSPVSSVEKCWHVGLVYSNTRPDGKCLVSAIIKTIKKYFIILKQSDFVSVTHKVANCHIYYN